jgi:hypothetical protein
MKVQKINSGVYRFEPEESDVPVWDQSQEQLRSRGWSAQLLNLVEPYLRPGRAVLEPIEREAEKATAPPVQQSSK